MAPENPDRFVVIDGVQVSRARAIRRGLIPSEHADGPSETRARTADSARRPEGRTNSANVPAAGGITSVPAAQVDAGAVSVGEDAARAGAASTPAADASASTGDTSIPPAGDSSGGAGDTSTPPADTAAAVADVIAPADTTPPADTSSTAADTSTPTGESVAKGDGKSPRARTR